MEAGLKTQRGARCSAAWPVEAAGRLARAPRWLRHRAGWALVDQVVVSGVSFLMAVMVARFGEPRELGLYGLGFSVIAGLYAVQAALIATPYALRRQQRPRTAAAAGGTAVLMQLGVMALAAAGLVAAGGLLHMVPLGPEGLGAVLLVAAVAGTAMLGREFVRRMAFAHLRVSWALVIDLPTAAVQLALVGVLALTDALTAATALAALGGGCVVGMVLGGVILRRHWTWPGRAWPLHMRWNWRCGRWIAAAQALAAINAHGLLWLVAVCLDAEATGVFAACLWVVMLSNPFVYGLGNLLTPRSAEAMAREGAAGLHRLVLRAASVLAGATGLLALGLFVAGDVVLSVLFGQEYADHAHTAAVLALAAAVGAAGMAVNDALRALGRPDAELTATGLDTGLTLVLGAAGLLLIGLPGLAYASLIGAVAGAGVQVALYRRLRRGGGRR